MATATPVSKSEQCSLGHEHRPRPRYVELHHVVPRAWQAHWNPPGMRLVGMGTPPVWDPRTVPLCRTSHGNVHDLLVTLMHAHAAGRPADLGSYSKAELAVAQLGMARWIEWGGSLDDLTGAGLWGEI